MNDNVCSSDLLEKDRLLIVDDDEGVRSVISEILAMSGFDCLTVESGEAALEVMEKEAVNLVITDINMPGMSGVDLVKIVKRTYQADVLVMTGYIGSYSYEQIIEAGASDFITKPVSGQEIILRVKRILRERCLVEDSAKAHLELQDAYLDTIQRLALAAEYKDEDTGDHIIRLSKYCAFLAAELGMNSREVFNIRYATPMHDIGKIGIPDKILLKAGKLTREEFDIMKTHTTIGAKILANSKSEILKMAQQIAISHHEKYDGTGYPQGLKGKDIPLPGRIVALTDTFDALSNKRPYKDPYPLDVTLDIIKKERGKQFDPDILDLFLKRLDSILVIREEVGYSELNNPDSFSFSERDLIRSGFRQSATGHV